MLWVKVCYILAVELTMTRQVILWTAPRSLSTAFYQSMATLESTSIKCFLELLMYPYYFSPSPPAAQIEDPYPTKADYLAIEPSYTAFKHALFQAYPNVDVVFTKEMAKHLPPRSSDEYHQILHDLKDVKHTFLIRDPAKVIYSHHKLFLQNVPIEKVPGLLELYYLYSYITKTLGKNAVVIDADDLQAKPDETMKLYCEAIGVPFEAHMTTWEAGETNLRMPVKEWNMFVDKVKTSTGFIVTPYSEQNQVPLDDLPQEKVEYVKQCRPYYKELQTVCLRPQSND